MESNQLSFVKGDKIRVLDKWDDYFSLGEFQNKIGIFPTSAVYSPFLVSPSVPKSLRK